MILDRHRDAGFALVSEYSSWTLSRGAVGNPGQDVVSYWVGRPPGQRITGTNLLCNGPWQMPSFLVGSCRKC